MNMKRGLDLAQLTNELEFRHDNRKDYGVSTKNIQVQLPMAKGQSLLLSFFDPADPDKQGVVLTFPMGGNAITDLCNLTHFPYSELLRVIRKGTDHERSTLGNWLTVRLNQNPTHLTLRTFPRFWEDPLIVAMLLRKDLAQSSMTVLNQILGLSLAIKGLEFQSASLTDNYMTVKVVGLPSAKGGPRAGLMFQYSETGSLSVVRPTLTLEDGSIIIPRTHMMTWDGASAEQAKSVIMGARSAGRTYQDIANRKVPASFDIKQMLLAVNIPTEVIKGVMGQFQKAEPTHQNLVAAVARYAATSRVIDFDRATELESLAGSLLDFTNESWELYKLTEATNGNGSAKKASKKPSNQLSLSFIL